MRDKLLITIPKSGTHWLRYILGWHVDAGRRVKISMHALNNDLRLFDDGVQGHFKYHPEVLDMLGRDKVAIFLYRDPRDIIVSWVKWILRPGATYWFYRMDGIVSTFRSYSNSLSSSSHFRIRDGQVEPVRKGVNIPGLVNMHEVEDPIGMLIDWLPKTFMAFAGWLKEPDVLKVSYEALAANPAKELAPLAEAIGYPLDVMVERAKFRGTLTYRKGIVGDWKNEFTKEHTVAFNQKYQGVMEAYGYQL